MPQPITRPLPPTALRVLAATADAWGLCMCAPLPGSARAPHRATQRTARQRNCASGRIGRTTPAPRLVGDELTRSDFKPKAPPALEEQARAATIFELGCPHLSSTSSGQTNPFPEAEGENPRPSAAMARMGFNPLLAVPRSAGRGAGAQRSMRASCSDSLPLFERSAVSAK